MEPRDSLPYNSAQRAQKHRVLSTQKLAYRFINHTPPFPPLSIPFTSFRSPIRGVQGDSFPRRVRREHSRKKFSNSSFLSYRICNRVHITGLAWNTRSYYSYVTLREESGPEKRRKKNEAWTIKSERAPNQRFNEIIIESDWSKECSLRRLDFSDISSKST